MFAANNQTHMQNKPLIDSAGIVPLRKENGGWLVFLIQYRGYEQYWGCPKGHREKNETSREAAIRELSEETGLQIAQFFDHEPILEEFYWYKKGERCLKQVLYFLAEVEGKIALQKEEISNGQWFTLSEAIEKIVHPEGKSTLRQVERVLKS